MDSQEILYDVADRVATITLNRPEKLNAFTRRMRDGGRAGCAGPDAGDGVRAVIVRGAGRAFCAGADLSAGGGTFDYAKRDDAGKDGQRDGGGRGCVSRSRM